VEAGDVRDDRAAKIDGCPHDFDVPTGQCRRCNAHYSTIIDRYRRKALTAVLAAEAALAYVADAQRELGDVQALVARLLTPP
jgi:hypothetical protein